MAYSQTDLMFLHIEQLEKRVNMLEKITEILLQHQQVTFATLQTRNATKSDTIAESKEVGVDVPKSCDEPSTVEPQSFMRRRFAI